MYNYNSHYNLTCIHANTPRIDLTTTILKLEKRRIRLRTAMPLPLGDDTFSLSDDELLQRPFEDESDVAATDDAPSQKANRSKPHKAASGESKKKRPVVKKSAPSRAPVRLGGGNRLDGATTAPQSTRLATGLKNMNTIILKKIVETADKRDWDNNIREFLKTYRFNINPTTISTELAIKLAQNELEKPKRAAPSKAADGSAAAAAESTSSE